jgi:hypothetical protein
LPPAQVDLPAVLEVFHELVVEQVHRRLVDHHHGDLFVMVERSSVDVA